MTKDFYIFIYLDGIQPTLCARGIYEPGLFKLKYDEGYLKLKNCKPIDPTYYPITEQVIQLPRIQGALRDTMPDQWGQKLMDQLAGKKLTEVDYLLATGEDKLGDIAFSVHSKKTPQLFEPWDKSIKYHSILSPSNLEVATSTFNEFENTEELSDYFKEIISQYLSLGGSRPKATVAHNKKICIAKFEMKQESFGHPAAEFANMRLGKKCGLKTPWIGLENCNKKNVFLIERFDKRKINLNQIFKEGFITGETILKNDEGSYADLALALKKYGPKKNYKEDVKELYKLMLFNVLCNNLDDHLRNFGFLRKGKHWSLAPAYDLVASVSENRGHSLQIGEDGNMGTKENTLSWCEKFFYTKSEAEKEFDRMYKVTKNWRSEFLSAGISKSQVDVYKKCYEF